VPDMAALDPELGEDIAHCRAAEQALIASVAAVGDDDARRPSRLPGWTVGHVLTHLARNADSVTRRLAGAARGEVVDQYPGGREARAREIDEGAARSAAELLEDVRASSARLTQALDDHPTEAWGRPARDVTGVEQPVSILPYRRWREVEIHSVDLGLGRTPADWSAAFVRRALPDLLAELPDRTDPNALLAWVIGRGAVPDLGAF
jgi:maleylpyruvate isomerase